MLKRITTTFALLLMSLTGVAIVASPVQADVVWAEAPNTTVALSQSCTPTYICLHTGVFWDGTTFEADPWTLHENTCYNFDSFWNDNVNSLWWNEDDTWYAGSYAEMYENANCTGAVIARAWPGSSPLGQMRSCNEVAPWNGPCGPPNNVSKRASSWAFDLN